MDALAIVCKAADFDRSLFLTFAVLVLGPDANAMGRAREYGQIYGDLPRDAACRTIRFWLHAPPDRRRRGRLAPLQVCAARAFNRSSDLAAASVRLRIPCSAKTSRAA